MKKILLTFIVLVSAAVGRAESASFKTSLAIVSCATPPGKGFRCSETNPPLVASTVQLGADGGGTFDSSQSAGGYSFLANINIDKVIALNKTVTYLFDIGLISMKTGDDNSKLMTTALVQVTKNVGDLNEVTFSGNMIGTSSDTYFPEFTIAPISAIGALRRQILPVLLGGHDQ